MESTVNKGPLASKPTCQNGICDTTPERCLMQVCRFAADSDKGFIVEMAELIAKEPWRKAVTCRETSPHEYAVIEKDQQEKLIAEVYQRFYAGEGVGGRFFRMKNRYLFIGDNKYWLMTPCDRIDLDRSDYVINRALLYRDRRDFLIKDGDDGKRNRVTDDTFGITPSKYYAGD